jgi:hypothetical protein
LNKHPYIISRWVLFGLLFTFLVFTLPSCKDEPAIIQHGENNMAYKWSEIALQATARDTERMKPRPTVTSRYLALIFTAMFDAWSMYDENASPAYWTGKVIKPAESERTEHNKEIAISYAAYHTLMEFYPADAGLFTDYMKSLGINPEAKKNGSLLSPESIGIKAAEDVLKARKKDGSNHYGNEEGGNGKPYFDYTYYEPVNGPDEIYNLAKWQPKYFRNPEGERWVPECLTPYWNLVTPIAIDSANQFRPGPPPAIGSEQLLSELKEVVDLHANLTDEQKALVEFMRDGPASVQQAGHWLKFAQDVSRRDGHTLDDDIKMFFVVEVAAMDAFIACWDSKMFYDSARPYSLIHHYYENEIIHCWGGEGKTWVDTIGIAWRPYSPESFLCPAFPSYVSGHSAASGACSEILRMFTGSDHFGQEITVKAGALTEPGYTGTDVTIKLSTFSETANMAGQSRVLGGYHIASDNIKGLELGRNVAREVWMFYTHHLGK